MEEKTAKEVLIEKIWKGLVKTVASFMLVSLVAVCSMAVTFGSVQELKTNIVVSPFLENTFVEQTKAETVINLTKSKHYNICTVKPTDYAENWLTDDLDSLAKSARNFLIVHRMAAWADGGGIVIPEGASIVDLAPVKSYSWKEADRSGYQADYFVFKYSGYACKLERISRAAYKTEINLYCGLAR